MSALAEAPLFGSQRARIEVIPDGDEHPRWQEILETLARMGVVMDPWQERILWASLLRRGEKWAAFAVGVCCPRQNGKNEIVQARELVDACVLSDGSKHLLIHTAHLADTSMEAFRRLDDMQDENAFLNSRVRQVWRSNGKEAIEFTGGLRIRYRTRTRGGGRGFAGSLVVFDEAMYLPEVSMGSILPVISAQPDPQVWYAGSAVDQAIHEDGVVFARVRDRALSGEDDRLAYFEWSLDAETPDMVERRDLDSPDVWAVTNPALAIRIQPEYIRAERRELEDRTFAVERLGVGDWPPVDGSASQVIPIETWDMLTDDPKNPDARMIDPVFFAFDVTPDRAASAIVAAGRRADGLIQVEVSDHRAGTAWVPERLRQLVERNEPIGVLCDPAGPAGSLLPACDDLGVDVEEITASDLAKACGHLFDLVGEQEIRHMGGASLRNAVKGATRRSLGDAWAWSRRNSTVDISPLVAATLALWGFKTNPYDGEIVIY